MFNEKNIVIVIITVIVLWWIWSMLKLILRVDSKKRMKEAEKLAEIENLADLEETDLPEQKLYKLGKSSIKQIIYVLKYSIDKRKLNLLNAIELFARDRNKIALRFLYNVLSENQGLDTAEKQEVKFASDFFNLHPLTRRELFNIKSKNHYKDVLLWLGILIICSFIAIVLFSAGKSESIQSINYVGSGLDPRGLFGVGGIIFIGISIYVLFKVISYLVHIFSF